jgi:hypothetical protein
MAPSLDGAGYTEPSRIVTSGLGGCQGIRTIRSNHVRRSGAHLDCVVHVVTCNAGASLCEAMTTPLLRGFPPVVADLSFSASIQTRDTTPGWLRCFPTARISGALWDVLRACRRAGTADSAIDSKSLVVNDFAELFAEHPTITRVYFNGAKAAELFRRLAAVPERIRYQRLPSTSPARVMKPGEKLAAWRALS